jgi:alpha-L-fucosidase 2
MWLHYRYSMDTEFLRTTAYPFMKGAMRIYEAVMEEENGQMVLPMSTSPEYDWSGGQAVGRNPSFQWACVHFLLESLITATELLDVDPEDRTAWQQLKEKVPHYTTFTDADSKRTAERQGPGAELDALPRIAILEDQDLEFSHRHHGHLAAIHPFDTVDPEDEAFDRVLQPTLRHWVEIGTGNWIAFSFTAASIIYSRLKEAEAAYLHYQIWHHAFANEHRGAVELAHTPGLTTWTNVEESTPMQMDAIMGAVNAIQEMLLHTVRGTMCVFPAIPRAWQKSASFKAMRAEGAFLVSAEMKEGRITKVEIFSEKGAELKLTNNIAAEIIVCRGEKEARTSDRLLRMQTEPGETITIHGVAVT